MSGFKPQSASAEFLTGPTEPITRLVASARRTFAAAHLR